MPSTIPSCTLPATAPKIDSLAASRFIGCGGVHPVSYLTCMAFVAPCGNWRRVDDRFSHGMSPLWGVINTNTERLA